MAESGKTAPFKSILCGVEGNPASTIAARASVALQTPETSLRFVAVDASFELRPEYTKESLEAALEEAMGIAEEAGVDATSDMPAGKYASRVLLAEAANHDLLVIGTHNKSRVAGIVLGSTASESVHETERPLLIAREPPNGGGFFDSILLATDGSEGSRAAAKVAGPLAAAYGGKLEVLHVSDGKETCSNMVLEAEVTELERATGTRPELSTVDGHPTDKIVDVAAERGNSLIVCGRRGVSGIKSLGSVSERVVHQAETSVLLIPNA
jgi:nucleotide-binding universal stress UspA family protein